MVMDEKNILDENIIELTDENNKTVQFEHLMTFEHDDEYFIAMLPIHEEDGYAMDEVLLMQIEEGEEEDSFLPIESEEKLEELWEVFQQYYYEDDEEEDEEE